MQPLTPSHWSLMEGASSKPSSFSPLKLRKKAGNFPTTASLSSSESGHLRGVGRALGVSKSGLLRILPISHRKSTALWSGTYCGRCDASCLCCDAGALLGIAKAFCATGGTGQGHVSGRHYLDLCAWKKRRITLLLLREGRELATVLRSQNEKEKVTSSLSHVKERLPNHTLEECHHPMAGEYHQKDTCVPQVFPKAGAMLV